VTKLVEYGIQNEGSNIRVHVCYVAKYAYEYPTQSGIDAIKNEGLRRATATQPGVDFITARGVLVPPEAIDHCRWYRIPDEILSSHRISKSMSTSEKGDKAAHIVADMMRGNAMPILCGDGWVIVVRQKQLQFDGVDIRATVKIQVKLDMRGGHKKFGGTGNLFLQTHERNPLKQYGESTAP
jgi:hypothetical protein